MRFIVIGVGVGLVAAFVLMRLLKSQIYGVTAYDPVTLLAVVLILAFVGVAACYLPSRRAIARGPARLFALRVELP